MLSDRASEPYRQGCGCHIGSCAGERRVGGEGALLVNPPTRVKNDQCHEFANREMRPISGDRGR